MSFKIDNATLVDLAPSAKMLFQICEGRLNKLVLPNYDQELPDIPCGSLSVPHALRWNSFVSSKMVLRPNWRSILAFACEARDEVSVHYAVASSIM
jgi:hypothetical protein